MDKAQRKLRPRGLNEKPVKGQLPARTGEIQLPINVYFTGIGSLELAKLATKSIERQLPYRK